MSENTSFKRMQIDKATRNMILVASASAFITIFCLIAGRSLLTILSYQNKVITQQQAALDTLNSDISTVNKLTSSYQAFNNAPTNVLGASSTGSGQNQGNNAKIILDALPSEFIYPAITNTIQNLFNNQGVKVNGVSVTNAGGAAASTSTTNAPAISAPIPIPISFSVTGTYQQTQAVLTLVNRSIMPIQILNMSFTGDQSNMTLSVSAQTYYQPAVGFSITTKAVSK